MFINGYEVFTDYNSLYSIKILAYSQIPKIANTLLFSFPMPFRKHSVCLATLALGQKAKFVRKSNRQVG